MQDEITAMVSELIQDLPRKFLKQVISEKLQDHGIKQHREKIAQAIVEHVMSETDDPFHWDDGSKEVKDVKITLTQNDLQEVKRRYETFLKDDLPRVMAKSVKACGKDLAKKLVKRWPEQATWERQDAQGFKERMDLPTVSAIAIVPPKRSNTARSLSLPSSSFRNSHAIKAPATIKVNATIPNGDEAASLMRSAHGTLAIQSILYAQSKSLVFYC